MPIHTLLERGYSHPLHCEDYVFHLNYGNKLEAMVVFDGCSSGIETVFSSILFGRIFRHTLRQRDQLLFSTRSQPDLKHELEAVMKSVFEMAVDAHRRLDLHPYEMLSTIIFALIDPAEKKAEVLAVGDGLVVWNEEGVEYDQNNQPDYLAYHLDEPFEDWYAAQDQFLSLTEVRDLSISTDGLLAFDGEPNRPASKDTTDIIDFFTRDTSVPSPRKPGKKPDNYLRRKLNYVKQIWKYQPWDDVAIARWRDGD